MFEIALGLFVGYLYGLISPIHNRKLKMEEVHTLYPEGEPFRVYGGAYGHTCKNGTWLQQFANNIKEHH